MIETNTKTPCLIYFHFVGLSLTSITYVQYYYKLYLLVSSVYKNSTKSDYCNNQTLESNGTKNGLQ